MNSGDCILVGWVGFGASDNGEGYLACECDGLTVFPFVCETSKSQQ